MILWKSNNRRAARIVHAMVAHTKITFGHFVTECDTEFVEQFIERWNIGTARVRHPPLTCVFIVELNFTNDARIVPIGKHDHAQFIVQNVRFQLLNFRIEIFFFWIDNQKCSIVRGIEAGKRLAEHFHVIASVSQMCVHVSKIGMYVIGSPIQWVRLHFEIVSGQIARRIPETVILIPQYSLLTRRPWNYFNANIKAGRTISRIIMRRTGTLNGQCDMTLGQSFELFTRFIDRYKLKKKKKHEELNR